jgi:hypothetical protein
MCCPPLLTRTLGLVVSMPNLCLRIFSIEGRARPSVKLPNFAPSPPICLPNSLSWRSVCWPNSLSWRSVSFCAWLTSFSCSPVSFCTWLTSFSYRSVSFWAVVNSARSRHTSSAVVAIDYLPLLLLVSSILMDYLRSRSQRTIINYSLSTIN